MSKILKNRKSAFTLVEILVVILIIGLLFAFLVPKIDNASDKARETGIKTDMRSYQIAIEAVAKEHAGLGNHAIPDTATDGDNVIRLINGYLDPALKITYEDSDSMKTAKIDPWNNPYLVDFIDGADGSSNGIVTVRTLGKDMRDEYDASKLDSSYTADGLGTVSGDVDADIEDARKGSKDSDKADDYISGTWYIDGQIMSNTAGFTRNIIAIKKTASAGGTVTDCMVDTGYVGTVVIGGSTGNYGEGYTPVVDENPGGWGDWTW